MKIVITLLAVLVLSAGFLYKLNYAKKTNNFDINSAYIKGGNFDMTGPEGKVELKEFYGRPIVLYFGFASCPDICPMSLSFLKKASKEVSEKSFQVIFVSVDYKRDDAKKVDQYAKFFNKNFKGFSGSKSQIDRATSLYGAYYDFIPMKKSELEYTVDHSSRFYLIDKNGKLKKSIHSNESLETFVSELKSIL